MKRTAEFNHWLLRHPGVTMKAFNNLGETMQKEVYQVYLNQKEVERILK